LIEQHSFGATTSAKRKAGATLDADLQAVLEALLVDRPLDPKHGDHVLTQNWKGFRECHVKPDLLLIYRLPDARILELHRLGSHSELGL
jgi:mRNA interferase YafQ